MSLLTKARQEVDLEPVEDNSPDLRIKARNLKILKNRGKSATGIPTKSRMRFSGARLELALTTAATPGKHTSFSGAMVSPFKASLQKRRRKNVSQLFNHQHGRQSSMCMTSPNKIELSDVSQNQFVGTRSTTTAPTATRLLPNKLAGASGMNKPSDLESNIQSIVDTLKS